jgi:hypothetical protein
VSWWSSVHTVSASFLQHLMAATLPFALLAPSQALTLQEALSGVFGSISLATWIFLLVRIRPPDTLIDR